MLTEQLLVLIPVFLPAVLGLAVIMFLYLFISLLPQLQLLSVQMCVGTANFADNAKGPHNLLVALQSLY